MNKVILMGRLTRDPDVRYSQGENASAFARYTLAVDRRFRRDGEATADFIGCVAFGRQAEFAEKYLRQGTKIAITGRIQTGSYTNRDGQKGLHHRRGCRGTGICGEQGGSRRARRRLPAPESFQSVPVCTGSFRSSGRWIHEHPGWHRRRITV